MVDRVLDDAAAAVSTLIEIHGSQEHRMVLAHALVGMAEGISRQQYADRFYGAAGPAGSDQIGGL